MTISEALQIFEIDGNIEKDELIDIYEEKIFQFSQYFLSKTPISKLFESKYFQLEKIGFSFDLLANEQTQNPLSTLDFSAPSEYILPHYLHFQRKKNWLKTEISKAKSAVQLIYFAKKLVELEKLNAEIWFSELEMDPKVLVSREPNPMEILESIKIFNLAGGETFEQLKKLENNPPEILIQEMKRLSLLFKKY